MTSWPIPENHHHWWLVTETWDRLHAVPETAVTEQDWEREAYHHLSAVCGLAGDLSVPGVSARVVLPRCRDCCQLIGITGGRGTPVNEASRKAAEQRKRLEQDG